MISADLSLAFARLKGKEVEVSVCVCMCVCSCVTERECVSGGRGGGGGESVCRISSVCRCVLTGEFVHQRGLEGMLQQFPASFCHFLKINSLSALSFFNESPPSVLF